MNSKFSVLCFALVFLLLSCRTRTSQVEISRSASTNDGAVVKTHSGRFNFGISFSEVTEQIGKDFWNSWNLATSYSGRMTSEAKSGQGSYFLGEKAIIIGMTHPNAKKELKVILSHFFNATKKWARLACVDIDMTKAVAGIYLEQGPTVIQGRSTGNESFLKCLLEREPGKSDKVLSESLPVPTIEDLEVTLDLDQAENLRGSGKPHIAAGTASALGAPNALVASMAPYVAQGDEKFSYTFGNSLTVLIAGDYVVPLFSWTKSKAFAVPVMKFNSDPKSSNYLKPIAWYDFGALYLMSLPKENIVLSSRMGENLAKVWSSTNAESQAGYLLNKFPASRIHTYLNPDEHFASGSTDERMERVPVGSVHFIAGAYWNQSSRGLGQLLTLSGFTRQELLDLYLNQKDQGLWINTLDAVSFSDSAASHAKFLKFSETSDCGLLSGFAGLSEGTFVEAEVILGMQPGRDAMFKGKMRKIHVCDEFKDK